MPSGIRNVIILLTILTLILIGVSIYVGLGFQRKPSIDNSPVEASSACGNNVCDEGETCDGINQCEGKANYSIGDCRNSCTYCGDGIVQGGEDCDDGNDNSTDECNNSCRFTSADLHDPVSTPSVTPEITPIPSVTPEPTLSSTPDITPQPTVSVNTGQCGNATCDKGESCDGQLRCSGEGSFAASRSCRVNCTYCGDGILQVGEDCDDGNTNDMDECSNECEKPVVEQEICGDGIIQPSEQCDPAISPQCSNGNTCNTQTCKCITNPSIQNEKICGIVCNSNAECAKDNICENGKCILLACSSNLGNLPGNIDQSNRPAVACSPDKCSVLQCGSTCGTNGRCPNGLACNPENKCVFAYCINNKCDNQCVLPRTSLSTNEMRLVLQALMVILVGLVSYQVFIINNSYSLISIISGFSIFRKFSNKEKLRKSKDRFERSF